MNKINFLILFLKYSLFTVLLHNFLEPFTNTTVQEDLFKYHKRKFEGRKNYLLDERDLLWEVEISGPSRLSFQSLCPRLASYDKDPLQMLLSPLQQPIIIVSKNSICLHETQRQIWKLPMRSQTLVSIE